MIYYICSDSNFLAHHGIKGMHWGVRRYQNYDGTRIDSSRPSKFFDRHKKDPKVIAQDKLASDIRKNPENRNAILDKAISKERLDDIANKRQIMMKAIENARNDQEKIDKYEDEYRRRNLEWALNDMKKTQPDMYKDVLDDCKTYNYSPIEHKYVEMWAFSDDSYEKIEPFSPPETEKTKASDAAFDDWHSACREYTNELIGKHGDEYINYVDPEYGQRNQYLKYLINDYLYDKGR